jgi:hypothetical protein
VRIPLIVAAVAALALTAPSSQATVINSAYTPLGGNSWLVDFTITNDGAPASFAGFTIDFPNATNLVLRTSPSTWDSAVFQPDPGLPDAGFLDSFVRNASNALPMGQSIAGFGVAFSYAAGAIPGPLPFLVYSENFTPLFAGSTTVAAIPEPPTVFMAALGLALVGLRTVRRHRKTCNSAREVTA